MCSDKKSEEPSYKWPVMPIIVNTEDKWLSTPIMGRLCQDEKCQSTRCFKKKSPVRSKYKYDKNSQPGSSSEKENRDPKKRQSTGTKEVIEFKNQANRDTKIQLEL